ncbi:uncharacterized protein LOC144565371 [Carex rostrata]
MVKWTEEFMNTHFFTLLKDLKDSDMEAKYFALSYIKEYMDEIKYVDSSSTQESLSLFKNNITEVIDAILCIQESIDGIYYGSSFWFRYLNGNWPLENLDIFIPRIVKILLANLPCVKDDDALSDVDMSKLENYFPYKEASGYIEASVEVFSLISLLSTLSFVR